MSLKLDLIVKMRNQIISNNFYYLSEKTMNKLVNCKIINMNINLCFVFFRFISVDPTNLINKIASFFHPLSVYFISRVIMQLFRRSTFQLIRCDDRRRTSHWGCLKLYLCNFYFSSRKQRKLTLESERSICICR